MTTKVIQARMTLYLTPEVKALWEPYKKVHPTHSFNGLCNHLLKEYLTEETK